MPAPNARQEIQTQPLSIVGGNKFGRYNKVNDEQTYNMIVSDDALVPYAGFKLALTTGQAEGRGLYTSTRGRFMFVVTGNVAYKVTGSGTNLLSTILGSLETSSGDVYIAENNNSQIAVTDGAKVYVYNYSTNVFVTLTSGAAGQFPYQNPGYISFQNGRLIVVSGGTTVWALSALNDALTWTGTGTYLGSLQTKPDFVQAAVPSPGGGNNLLLFGRTVTEQWQDVGAALFPYQRASTFNVDYGCINASTIAHLNNFVVWLSINDQAGPVLTVAQGASTKQITTDGIDFKINNLTDPTNCTAFLFQQDGHLIYQFTFITDNLSYAYDFETGLFFSVSDPDLNYHPAREVVYYNNYYYFVSLNDGNVYLFSSIIPDAFYSETDVRQIPRIRITPPLRLPSQRMFIIKSLGFTVENGRPNEFTTYLGPVADGSPIIDTEDSLGITTQNSISLTTEENTGTQTTYTLSSSGVDLSISRDGGENFGSSLRLDMSPTGKRRSRFIFQRLGQANDASFQLRFYGFERFVAFNGEVEYYI